MVIYTVCNLIWNAYMSFNDILGRKICKYHFHRHSWATNLQGKEFVQTSSKNWWKNKNRNLSITKFFNFSFFKNSTKLSHSKLETLFQVSLIMTSQASIDQPFHFIPDSAGVGGWYQNCSIPVCSWASGRSALKCLLKFSKQKKKEKDREKEEKMAWPISSWKVLFKREACPYCPQ